MSTTQKNPVRQKRLAQSCGSAAEFPLTLPVCAAMGERLALFDVPLRFRRLPIALIAASMALPGSAGVV